MSTEDAPALREELQFDRAETDGSPADATTPGVVCTACRNSIDLEYHLLNGAPMCDACRQAVLTAVTKNRGWKPFVRAGLFGLGAAIAGAILYYGVIALLELEIGIVAIAIGYMVGYAVRKGAAGVGGRRFQVLALLLTYWSVGLAYTPLAFKAMSETPASETAATGSTESAPTAPATQTAPTPPATPAAPAAKGAAVAPATNAVPMDLVAFLLGIVFILVLAFALPVLVIGGSLPSGLLSALIILFGLLQAWKMTAAPSIEVEGPFQVGPGLSPAAG